MAFFGENQVSAWCNMEGRGSISIRDSYNISSITDHGTGNYGFSFSTSLPNHAVTCEGEESGDTNSGSAFTVMRRHSTNSNSTRVRCCTGPGGGFFDFEHVYIIVCHDG
tara:strand:+ start:70 stop:396 length:327 start_codon:yes stop_codon:yes gene_type:complete